MDKPIDQAMRESDPVDAVRPDGPAVRICPVPPQDSETPSADVRIVPGDVSKERFIACWLDNLLALALAMVSATAVPSADVALRVCAMIGAYLAYFYVSEAVIGTSPGKLMFGLWVRRIEGGPCSWRQAAVRTLARLVEVNPILLGAIPAGIAVLASTNRQRIGDMMAGTVVRKGRNP